MYLLVTRHGTWLKCYNSECHGKNIRLNEDQRPSNISELFQSEPEIGEDICGGGESECGEEEGGVERPRKVRRRDAEGADSDAGDGELKSNARLL